MKMRFGIFKIIFGLTVICSHSVSACIWQNGPEPFWPSTNIEVCFLPPGPEDQQHLEDFRRAQQIIARTYRQMNRQSEFTYSGFNECTDLNESNREPKIRIDLVTGQMNGRAASIGPQSSTEPMNLEISYMAALDKESDALVLRNDINLSFITAHETIHLLGFHHDRPRTDTKEMNTYAANDCLILGDFAEDSVMHISGDVMNAISRNEPMAPVFMGLSPEDRRCLRMVADRSINSVVNNNLPNEDADLETSTIRSRDNLGGRPSNILPSRSGDTVD